MNKLIVITFDTEEDAYEGLNALQELDEKGDISLYASAVLSKDVSGEVTLIQADDKGPLATAVGMLTGALVGALAGPVGMAVGTAAGSLSGALIDLGDTGVNLDFVEEVSKILLPGTTFVVADVDEEWVAPIDTKIAQFDGLVFRRLKSEVIEEQLSADSEAFEKESQAKIDALKAKMKDAKEKQKTRIEKKIAEIEAERKERSENLKSSIKHAKEALKPN